MFQRTPARDADSRSSAVSPTLATPAGIVNGRQLHRQQDQVRRRPAVGDVVAAHHRIDGEARPAERREQQRRHVTIETRRQRDLDAASSADS